MLLAVKSAISRAVLAGRRASAKCSVWLTSRPKRVPKSLPSPWEWPFNSWRTHRCWIRRSPSHGLLRRTGDAEPKGERVRTLMGAVWRRAPATVIPPSSGRCMSEQAHSSFGVADLPRCVWMTMSAHGWSDDSAQTQEGRARYYPLCTLLVLVFFRKCATE